LSKFSLFKIVESLDNALQIMIICLNNKGAILKFEKTYSLVFFSLFFNTYITATIELYQEGSSMETTVARLSDMIISQQKEINSLKVVMADFKDQINTFMSTTKADFKDQINIFMSTMNEKFVAQEKIISELKPKINIIEDMQSLYDISALSKILKKEEYELLKTWIGSNFELELLYSTYNDGDKAATFHSKCDGISPTLTVIQSSNGNRFGGYTNSKWDSIGSYINGDGSDFIFSLDNKAKYMVKDRDHAIYGGTGYSVTFGGGHDIFISNGCTANNKNYCKHYSYNIPSHIAGSYNFIVTYMEVFKVINKN
jgi:hypothetical protein